jgi:hypothetical protein
MLTASRPLIPSHTSADWLLAAGIAPRTPAQTPVTPLRQSRKRQSSDDTSNGSKRVKLESAAARTDNDVATEALKLVTSMKTEMEQLRAELSEVKRAQTKHKPVVEAFIDLTSD